MLRPARPEDAEAMCRVHRASVLTLAAEHYETEQLEEWVVSLEPDHIRMAIADRKEVGFVVERDGRVVGFALCDGDLVRALYVHPAAARQGLGTLLLEALENEAAARGVARLRLYASVNSRCFYEANGYRVLRAGDYPLSGVEMMTCLEMEKDVPNPGG
ncbi:MAG: GNAT family N-acetyltransferase [Syntrophobacteraceae bacterium]